MDATYSSFEPEAHRERPSIPLNQHGAFAGYGRAMRTVAGRAGVPHHHVALGVSTHVAISKSDATLRSIQIEMSNADDIEQDSDRVASAGTPTVAAALGLRLDQFPAPTLGRIHLNVTNFNAPHGEPGAERRDSLLLTAPDFIKFTPTRTT